VVTWTRWIVDRDHLLFRNMNVLSVCWWCTELFVRHKSWVTCWISDWVLGSSLGTVCIWGMCSTRESSSSLSRLVHDMSRIYSLLILKTDNTAARNLLITTAQQLHKFVSWVVGPSLMCVVSCWTFCTLLHCVWLSTLPSTNLCHITLILLNVSDGFLTDRDQCINYYTVLHY